MFKVWANSDVQYDIALGLGQLAPYIRGGIINGYNPSIQTAFQDVWDVGGSYPLQIAPGGLTVVSSSAADTLAGTGARQVAISGYDATGAEQTALVSLSGTTPVSVGPMQWVGPVTCTCVQFGAGEANAGDVTVTRTVGGAIQSRVRSGVGVSQNSIYQVPFDHDLIIGSFFLSGNPANATKATGNTLEFRFGVRLPGSGGWIYPASFECGDNSGPIEFNARPSVAKFPAGSVMKFQCRAPSADPPMRVSTGMIYTLAKSNVSYFTLG